MSKLTDLQIAEMNRKMCAGTYVAPEPEPERTASQNSAPAQQGKKPAAKRAAKGE